MRFNKNGSTIVELVLYLALLSVFLGVVTDIFISSLNLQTETSATSAVQNDADYLLSRLTYDIRRATSIAIPATINQSTNSAQLVINGTNYQYSVSNGNFLLNNTNQLNSYSTTISNLSFQRLGYVSTGKNSLKIAFTVASKAKRETTGYEIRSYTTTVAIR